MLWQKILCDKYYNMANTSKTLCLYCSNKIQISIQRFHLLTKIELFKTVNNTEELHDNKKILLQVFHKAHQLQFYNVCIIAKFFVL